MAISLTKNIAANLVGKIWGFISVFVFVPIYISLLGLECYGVISFYVMLLSLLVFADAGLTATLSREFARVDSDDPNYKQTLLRTFEYIYVSIGVLLMVSVGIFANDIVRNFIKSESIPFDDLVEHVRIMGAIIFFTLTCSLYQGGLMGLQHQVLSNTLSIFYGIVRSALVLIPLIWISDLGFYFYWQLAAVIIYLVVLRYSLMKFIKTTSPVQANFSYLKKVWKYALGMMAMAVIAAINTQVDKLTISKLLTLRDFTNYSLASVVSQMILFLATPIAVAMYPELTRLVSIKADISTRQFFHKYSFLIASVTSATAVVIACYTYDYLIIWTHDTSIAQAIQYPTKILTVGCLFLALQFCPYYLALANGHTRTNVILGVSVIVCISPLLLVLIPKYGLNGAAIPWLAVNFFATWILGYILINKFMKGEFFQWLVHDTILPLAVSGIIGVVFYFLFNLLTGGWYTLAYGIVMFILMILANGVIFCLKYPEYKEHRFIKNICFNK